MQAIASFPSSVHFGGFTSGATHTCSVRITNVSAEPVKIDILPTASGHFNIVEVQKQLPKLAPGISETVTVQFKSDTVRYFYDFFRVKCSTGDEIQVDLHAYPVSVSRAFRTSQISPVLPQVLSTFKIPRNISLGEVPLGSIATHEVNLRSGIPVGFDFSLAAVTPHPAISVSPSSGTLKGDEATRLVFTFEPLDFSTALAVYRVNCSQFSFEPYDVTVSGNSRPGAVRDELIRTKSQGVDLLSIAKSRALTAGNTRGAGAGAAFDPGTALLEKSLARSKVRVAVRQAKQLAAEAAAQARGEGDMHELLLSSEGEALVDGVRVPAELSGQGVTNYILMQAQGKLKPKDIPLAVAAHRSIMLKQSAALQASSTDAQAAAAPGPFLSPAQVEAQIKAASWAVRAAVWAGGLGFSQRSKQAMAQADARRAHMADLRSQLEAAQSQLGGLSQSQRAKSARTWNASLGKTSLLERSARLSVVKLDERIKALQGALLREAAVLQAQTQADAAAGKGYFDVDVTAMLEAVRGTPPGQVQALEAAVADMARHGSLQLSEASGATLAGCCSPYAGKVAASMNAHSKDAEAETVSSDASSGIAVSGAAVGTMLSRDVGADDALTLRRSLLASSVQAIRTAEQDRRTLSKVSWLGEAVWPEAATAKVRILREQLADLHALLTSRAAARQSHTHVHGGEVSSSRLAHKVARPPSGPVVLVLPPSGIPHGLQDAQARAAAAAAGLDDSAAAAEVAARRAAVDCLRDLLTTRVIRDRAARRLGSLRRRLAHVWRIAGSDPAARRAAVQDLVQKDEQHAAASRDASSTWLAVQPAWMPPAALLPAPPKARAAGDDSPAQGTKLILGQNILPRVQESAIQPVPDADTDALTVSAATALGAFAQAYQRTKEAFKAGALSAAQVGPKGDAPALLPTAVDTGVEAPCSISGADLWPVLRHMSATGAPDIASDALVFAVAQATGLAPMQVIARQLQLAAEQGSHAAPSAAATTAPPAGAGTLTALRASSTVLGMHHEGDAASQAAVQALHGMGGVSHALQHSASCDAIAWWADDDIPHFDMQYMQPAYLQHAQPVALSIIAPTPPLCLGQPLRVGASYADDLDLSMAGVVTSCLQPAPFGATAVPQPVPGLICSQRFALQAVQSLRCAKWEAADVLPDMRWVSHASIQAAQQDTTCTAMTPTRFGDVQSVVQSSGDAAALLSRLGRTLGDLGAPALRQWLLASNSAPQHQPEANTLHVAEGGHPSCLQYVEAVSQPGGGGSSGAVQAALGLHSARRCQPSPPVPPSVWEPLLQFVRGGLPTAAFLQLPVLDATAAADTDGASSAISAAVGSLRFTVQQRWRDTGVLVDGIRICASSNTGYAAQIHMPPAAVREAQRLAGAAPTADDPDKQQAQAGDIGRQVPHAMFHGTASMPFESACGVDLVHSGTALLPSVSAQPTSVAHSLLQSPASSFSVNGALQLFHDPFSPMHGSVSVCTRQDAASATFGCAVALGGGCDLGMWQSLPINTAASRPELDWSGVDTLRDEAVFGHLDVSAIGQAELPSQTTAWLGSDSQEGTQQQHAAADSGALLPDVLVGMQPTAAVAGLLRECLGGQLQAMLSPAQAPTQSLGAVASSSSYVISPPGYLGASWQCSSAQAVHAESNLSDDSESDSDSVTASTEQVPDLYTLMSAPREGVRLHGAHFPFPAAVPASSPWACHGHPAGAARPALMPAFPWHSQCLRVAQDSLGPFPNMLATAMDAVLAAHSKRAHALFIEQESRLAQLQLVIEAHICHEMGQSEQPGCLPLLSAANCCPTPTQRLAAWAAFAQSVSLAAALGVIPEVGKPRADSLLLPVARPTLHALHASKQARLATFAAALPGPLFAPWAGAQQVSMSQTEWCSLVA